MAKFKAAIIGCKNIATNAHLPAYIALKDEVEVKWFVDINLDTAIKLRDKYGSGEVYADYHDILNNPEVDMVSVCTPNDCHAPISIDFLRAGKHVLCEKPASVNAEMAAKMQQAAHETGKILNIGTCMRYNTAVEKIHDMIEKGMLGEIYHVVCAFRAYRSIPGLGGPFTTKENAGGGALIDWGVHYLDLIAYCLGEPAVRSVSAATYSKLGSPIEDYVCKNMWAGPRDVNGTYDVDDFVTGFIRTEGPSITLNGAWAQNIDIDERYVDFIGTKGGIHYNYCGGFTYYSTQDGMMTSTAYTYQDKDMYTEEIRDFLVSIRTGEKKRSYIDHAIKTSVLMDRIYASAAEEKEI